MFIYALVFPYIFLLVDCFEWALIDGIEKRSGPSLLWQFRMGGSPDFGVKVISFTIHLYIYICHSTTCSSKTYVLNNRSFDIT